MVDLLWHLGMLAMTSTPIVDDYGLVGTHVLMSLPSLSMSPTIAQIW